MTQFEKLMQEGQPMVPAEVVAKAIWDSADHGTVQPWEEVKKRSPTFAAKRITAARNAIRALANIMTPSMLEASYGAYDGDDYDSGVRVVTREVLLAAAAEGEEAGGSSVAAR